MKYVSRLLLLSLITTLFFSCSSDNNSNSEKKNESDLSKQEVSSLNAKLLVRETKKELDQLLLEEGFEEVTDKNFSIGTINEKKFNTASEKVDKILSLHFKLITQKIGYDVDYNEFEFLNAKDNNGYPMLISKGVCNITGEYVSLGVNVIENLNGKTQITHEGTTVTCSGCRRGCNPRKDSNGDGYCTDCSIANSTCTKTEVLN